MKNFFDLIAVMLTGICIVFAIVIPAAEDIRFGWEAFHHDESPFQEAYMPTDIYDFFGEDLATDKVLCFVPPGSLLGLIEKQPGHHKLMVLPGDQSHNSWSNLEIVQTLDCREFNLALSQKMPSVEAFYEAIDFNMQACDLFLWALADEGDIYEHVCAPADYDLYRVVIGDEEIRFSHLSELTGQQRRELAEQQALGGSRT